MSADPRTPLSGPEARLRDTLDQVATARPVAAAWDAIVEQVTAEADGRTVLRPLVRTGSDGPDGGAGRTAWSGRRRLALAAACVAAVAAIGAGVVAVRDDDRPDQVTGTAIPAEQTGWVVPVGLPKGWVLESVGTDFNDASDGGLATGCPCRRWVWSGPTQKIIHQTAGGTLDDLTAGDTAEAVEIAPGVPGFVVGDPGPTEHRFVLWEQDGMLHAVQAPEADGDVDQRRAALLEAARAVWSHPSDEAPAPGLDLAVSTEIPDVRSYRTVVATLRNTSSGRLASYGLSPSGFDILGPYYFDRPTEVTVPGEERELLRFGVNPQAAPGDADQYLYVGRWSGSDVFVGRFLEPAPTTPMYDDDLRTLAGALRPATAAEWEAFLDTATGQVDERARTPRLADLIQAN